MTVAWAFGFMTGFVGGVLFTIALAYWLTYKDDGDDE